MKKSVTEAIEKIRDTYSSLVIEHGADARAGGYRDEEKRNLRYDRLVRVLDDAPEQFTIAELGCGYEAFYTYLDELMPGRISHYDGYDVSAEMLKRGRDHLGGQPVSLMLEDHVVREADYVFISGIFNVKMNAPASDWQSYIEDTLKVVFCQGATGARLLPPVRLPRRFSQPGFLLWRREGTHGVLRQEFIAISYHR